jgi:hypothetical protein
MKSISSYLFGKVFSSSVESGVSDDSDVVVSSPPTIHYNNKLTKENCMPEIYARRNDFNKGRH